MWVWVPMWHLRSGSEVKISSSVIRPKRVVHPGSDHPVKVGWTATGVAVVL